MKYIPAGEIKNLNEDISKININENSDILVSANHYNM